ncbi:plasmid SOS inhibition protein A [Yersinia ruckeri]|uniref:plasmid SOS inhibition protein A n=1 Tax=Yersinia ruckeri TaxID=29486 RepID=UPI00068CEF2A|nr:plasmid SOS inhibition protein A [Yersinia ruckeri]AUQ43881.1 dipeptide ABC transporter ATP-binding protein [Yersinia ruckeri]WMS07363.1 plasmid SOS inhibition protein A [Yersinia ruckeri]
MIPNHLALVTINHFQAAVTQAIIMVETKREAGRKLPRCPYTKALFRALNEGRTEITAADIWRIDSGYDPRNRQSSTKQHYIEAIDCLIATQGEQCPLPLSGSIVASFFPETRHRHQERTVRRWDVKFQRRDSQQEKAIQQKRRRYQTLVAQAEVDLAYTTPKEFSAWNKRQAQKGIYGDDLIAMVQSWGRRFVSLNRITLYCLDDLYQILDDMHADLEKRGEVVLWLDTLMLPNKLGVVSTEN